MASSNAPGHDLLAFVTSTVLGAAATAPMHLPAAAALVANLVANLAFGYASGKIDPVLGRFNSEDWTLANSDLDRVAEHALLTILYETLIDNGIGEREAKRTVGAAGDSWDLRIFRDASPTEKQLIAFLRQPGPMPSEQAQRLAQHILTSHQSLDEAYSLAISDRFAPTFEVLLRADERAYRAAIVYLQRLSLGDLERLRAQLSNLECLTTGLAAAFDLLARPQPALDRYQDQKKGDSVPETTDLQFRRRAIRYRPREPVMRSITEWLDSLDPFRMVKITGTAGMGKSRLALELCDRYARDHWLAGFLAAGSDWPPNWIPNRPTLIVLDYAGSKTISGRPAFKWLESIFRQTNSAAPVPQGRPPRVRIVLLDRTDQGPLWSDWSNSDSKPDLDKVTLSAPLAPDRAEFDAIVADEFLRRKGCEPSPQENHAIEALAQRLRGQFRPLFASLSAAAVAGLPLGSTRSWSPELLIENMLHAQQRKWNEAAITDADLDLLFEATLTQGSCVEGWQERVEALTPAKLAALASLSEPGPLLGPVAPDLLGEFFILMRLRGQATAGTRLRDVNMWKANEIVAKSWQNENAALYVGRLLEDYLDWNPQDDPGAANPAADLMRQAMTQVEAGCDSFGLRYCCFAAAWKKPLDRDWPAWLRQCSTGAEAASAGLPLGIVEAIAIGLANATVGEPAPSQCLALAERIGQLHDEYGHEPAVRKQLATALTNATAVEPAPSQRLALAERIGKLHDEYGHEPAVRERLARALTNATAVEPAPSQQLALAERIGKLHDEHGHEPAVREELARALFNATVVEPAPSQRLALAERIEKLHDEYGHEPAVREQLARALFNATGVEPAPSQRLALAEGIGKLHDE